MKIVRWIGAGALLAATAAAGWIGYLRQLDGPIVWRGQPIVIDTLTLTPVTLVATQFALYPATTRAIEGRLIVPQNRVRPDGRTVGLHFLRLPATGSVTGEERGIPTVYLAGGPGESATVSLAGSRYEFFQALRQSGDVIALDQRGTEYSPPSLVCTHGYEFPLDDEATLERRAPILAAFIKECVREWAPIADLNAYNTRESARDLEDLRLALDVERINLVAVGYGTQLALEYMRRFPRRVENAVLAGVEAPHQIYKMPWQIDATFEAISGIVSAAVQDLFPDFYADVRQLLDTLVANPVRVVLSDLADRPEVVLGRMDVERLLYNLLATREGIAELPRWVGRMQRGDYRDLGRLAYAARLNGGASLMTVAVDCSAGVPPERLEEIRAQAETAILRDFANMPLRAACGAWTGTILGEDYREPVIVDTATLFISGSLDTRSPLDNAEEVMAGILSSWHLILEGAAHGDDLLLSSPRIAEVVAGFLRGDAPLMDRIVLPPIRFLRP